MQSSPKGGLQGRARLLTGSKALRLVRRDGIGGFACGAASFSDGRNDLPTAIRGPPPPRVAHSMPLGLLYLGTPAFFRRAGGSAVAPGFVVSPRPPGACFKGVCTRLGGFPVPRRKRQRRVPSPSGLKKYPGLIGLSQTTLSLAQRLKGRQLIGLNTQHVAFLGFVAPDFQRTHTGVGTEHIS